MLPNPTLPTVDLSRQRAMAGERNYNPSFLHCFEVKPDFSLVPALIYPAAFALGSDKTPSCWNSVALSA